jgi:tRNA1(Val) A37 N6-methylase TrmN6
MLSFQALDERRSEIARATPAERKSHFGQFMTPSGIALHMASLFSSFRGKRVRLLDAGAGIGSLTAAVVARAVEDGARSIESESWELDARLLEPLRQTLGECAASARAADIKFGSAVETEDFVLGSGAGSAAAPTCSHAILNPPYKKIRSDSAHRSSLRKAGIETGNLYSAFVALALKRLEHGGELVAITPRSFCNGGYFRPFREFLLSTSALRRVHVFESRTAAFKADEVLQENVIFRLVKGGVQGQVAVSVSRDASLCDLREHWMPFEEVVLPHDRESLFHLATEQLDDAARKGMQEYRFGLSELGLSVSTGPVVDFRHRKHLRERRSTGCVPMVYPHHFKHGFVCHPKADAKKPNFIENNPDTRRWLLPTGHYALLRRLSSKEEARRLIPAVYDPATINAPLVGFDNHTNVFHEGKCGLPATLARGLALYLASSFADRWLRRFSGHTQVNAGDLRALCYPSRAMLSAWGETFANTFPSQGEVDRIVDGRGA